MTNLRIFRTSGKTFSYLFDRTRPNVDFYPDASIVNILSFYYQVIFQAKAGKDYLKTAIFSPNDVRRYFVSPQESGELCLLSGLLGENRDISFPKFSAKFHLINFSEITIRYLRERGYALYECESEGEAPDRAEELIAKKQWPWYFFNSDTMGERILRNFLLITKI
ncbi:hypothetical protein N8135_03730 [Oceanospirillaceae bacterium]|nr:hypothetical protein [Oceanospirillaceae bacterium]